MGNRRLLWAAISIGVFFIFSVVGLIISKQQTENQDKINVSLNMPIKKVAKELGVSSDYFAKEAGIDETIDKEEKVSVYSVTQAQFDEAVEHILSHKPAVFKQFIMIGICIFGALFLLLWGRSTKNNKWYYNRTPYYISLAVTIIASFWLGKSPSPMEGVVKLFKAHAGLYPDVAAKTIGPTILIILFVVIVNKLVCGWACPFGALQELTNSLPFTPKSKRVKVPFLISNSIRAVIFLAFILVLFGVVGNLQGVTIYHYINPFNMFDFNFSAIGVTICVIATLVLSIFIYRPFCHFICPMGFVSWVCEQVSIFRVRIDHDTCIQCGKCANTCPSTACKAILDKKPIKPDCFSCARCLSACPVNAIKYGRKRKK